MKPGVNWIATLATLAVGGAVAWWTFRDARGRDANPLLWAAGIAVSALMVGYLGVLIVFGAYFLLRPRGTLLLCPHCKRRYIHNLAFCPHCGKPVKKECLRCHDTMPLDAEMCPHCGMKAP